MDLSGNILITVQPDDALESPKKWAFLVRKSAEPFRTAVCLTAFGISHDEA
jgi:hypothetical protein